MLEQCSGRVPGTFGDTALLTPQFLDCMILRRPDSRRGTVRPLDVRFFRKCKELLELGSRFGGSLNMFSSAHENIQAVKSRMQPPIGRVAAAAVAVLVSSLVLTTGQSASAQPEYPQMAPVGQYLIADRKAEIAMARSAAPESISRNATVLVLGVHGYQTAIVGRNGFVCLVERSWMSPFDSPEFWNPKIRGPICYNPPAARTILPYTINRTSLVLAGVPKPQMHERITASLAHNRLPLPAPGSMSYMMSKAGYLGDGVEHWHPHLMFHIRTTSAANWGANAKGSPVIYNDEYQDMPEPETIFMIPVARWSDGTAARPMRSM